VSCDGVQERLTELALAREAAPPERWEPPVREHVAGCAACRDHLRFVRALSVSLASELPPPMAPAALAIARARAARALRAQAPPRQGMVRELAVTFAVSLLALPLALAHAWLVTEGVGALLRPLLPGALVTGLGVAYLGSVALAVGAFYAVAPLWIALVRHARAEAS
jgi:hypothetical protein